MPRVTKTELEKLLEQSQRNFFETGQTIALLSRKIEALEELLDYTPNASILMSMLSTNKLARKMVEQLTGRIK